jgi:fatty-acid desaturase
MVLFGIVLMIIGLLLGVPVLWSLGVIVLIVGLVLWLLGALGHAVGGRRHYD